MASTTRRRSRRGEGEQLRTGLLDAAADLLDETEDVEQLSIRAVTARAGVSPMALYLHFADKDELARAVKLRAFAALGDALTEAQSTHPDDAYAQLNAMGLAYLSFARTHPGQYALMFHTRTARNDHAEPEAGTTSPGRTAGLEVFNLLVETVDRYTSAKGKQAFELATQLWMALHGRAVLQPAMPWFPFAEEDLYVDRLVTSLEPGHGTGPARKA
ncbi:TetR/AcrR family transcriptional regulator [Flindersiella endophytica]